MRDAGVESGCDFDAGTVLPVPLEAMVELETAFQARPGGVRGRRVLPALLVGLHLVGLYGADLCAQTGLAGETDLLFETHLRSPEPQVAGGGNRRERHLPHSGRAHG